MVVEGGGREEEFTDLHVTKYRHVTSRGQRGTRGSTAQAERLCGLSEGASPRYLIPNSTHSASHSHNEDMPHLGTTVLLAAMAALNDSAIHRLMKQSDYGGSVEVLHRTEVTPDLDLVAVLGTTAQLPGSPGGGSWWDDKRRLGLFLQNRNNPGLIYRLTLEEGPAYGNCFARVERATASEVFVSCIPEKGRTAPSHKFTFDVRARALIGGVAFDRFQMASVTASAGKAIVVGSDGHRSTAIEYTPGQNPAFRVVPNNVRPQLSSKTCFGPDNRFCLLEQREGMVIRERTGAKYRTSRLPQSRDPVFSVDERIASWQVSDGTLWFGKSFYKGEGQTGVGGFGYFDTDTRTWQILTPPEVRDWSVTAMLVEPSAVWLGLAHHGEWGSSPGGLLRYDRASGSATVFKGPAIIAGIVRTGPELVLATDLGIGIITDADTNPVWRRYFIDGTSRTASRILEAVPAANGEKVAP